jgi:hypothetical protein
MIDRYRTARAYSDSARVVLRYRRAGQRHEDSAPLSVAFQRGERLCCRAYAAEISIVRGTVKASIADDVTGNMDGQLLVRQLDHTDLTLADVYFDPELTHFATAGLGGPAPQLELLLSNNPLSGLFAGSATLTLGSTEQIGGADCQAVVVEADSMRYQFWIDRREGLLRRIELPPAAAGLELDTAVSDVRLTIELQQARFAADEETSFDLSESFARRDPLKRVRSFVPPPPPIISDLLGRRPADFTLNDPDGRTLASSKVDGENGANAAGGGITAMLWIADHPASRMAASQLQRIADARRAAGKNDCRFMIVMSEPVIHDDTLVAPKRDSETGNLLRSWKVGLPFADDTAAAGWSVFKIREAPTLVVLGPDGLVDWFAPRVGPEMATHLPMLIDDLAAGKKVGQLMRDQYEAAQQLYAKLLLQARQTP